MSQQCLLHKPKVVQQLDRTINEALDFSTFIINSMSIDGINKNELLNIAMALREQKENISNGIKKSLKETNFDEKINHFNNKYFQRLSDFVDSLGSYYDLGSEEGISEFRTYIKADCREDIDRLHNLIEILLP